MKKLNIIQNIRKFNRWGPLVDESNHINIEKSLIRLAESLLLILVLFAPLLAILQFITTCIEVIYNKLFIINNYKKAEKILLRYADKLERDIGLLYLEDHKLSTVDKLYINYNGYRLYPLFNNIHEPNIDMFIYMFFNKYNWHYDTMYIKNDQMQCSLSKRRSIGDIYLICKYYYKDITIINVINALERLSHNSLIHSSRCNTINKYVFTAGSQCHNGKLEMFNDTLNWNELIKILKNK